MKIDLKNLILFSYFLICYFFFSCRKDKPPEKSNPEISFNNNGGVYIACEGNFQFGNAKISYYDVEKDSATEDIFQPANNFPLGDVCQSMYFFNERIYIVVNNSGKIVVVNKKDFKLIATITGFISPRYFLPVSNNKAYITDYNSNTISIVDLSSNTIVGNVPCEGWTEELILSYGKVFITNYSKDKIYVINSSDDLLEDSIQVGSAPNSIKEDKNGKLWVLCGGSQTSSIYAGLHRINPITKQVEKSFQFPNLSDSPWRLDINGTNDTLYFLNSGVFRMEINSTALPNSSFILQGTKKFYGIGIEPSTGIIYVADAIDYVQRGKVYRYKSDGNLLNTFPVGIIPGDFYFN